MTDIRTISLPADTHHLAALRSFITSIVKNEDADPLSVHALELAVDEVVTNVIEHAVSGGDIFCSCTIDGPHHAAICEISWLAVEPFYPNALPGTEDIRKRIEAREPGGLGVYLIHSLIDEIQYDYLNGRSVIRLMKKL